MFVNIDPEQAYWFQAEQIRFLSERYQARYLGCWCVKQRDGSWSDVPVDVFYQPKPNLDLGHTNYFGVFLYEQHTMMIAADSAFSEPMTGVLLKSGEVLVSRFRHDYQCKQGIGIDGGRDYVKVSMGATQVDVQVLDGEFRFNEYAYA